MRKIAEGIEFLLNLEHDEQWFKIQGMGGPLGNGALSALPLGEAEEKRFLQGLVARARRMLKEDGELLIHIDEHHPEPGQRMRSFPVSQVVEARVIYSDRGSKQDKRDDLFWRRFHAARDVAFDTIAASEQWPSGECEYCSRRGVCCRSHNHHVGDCCLHCGNDERRWHES